MIVSYPSIEDLTTLSSCLHYIFKKKIPVIIRRKNMVIFTYYNHFIISFNDQSDNIFNTFP